MSTTFIIYPTTPVASVGRKLRAAFMIRAFSHFLASILAVLLIQALFLWTGWAEILAHYMRSFANGWRYALAAVPAVGWIATKFARHTTSKPAQYAAFALFIVLESVVAVPLVAAAAVAWPSVPACAALLALVAAVAIFAISIRQREEYRMGAAMSFWFVVAAVAAAMVFVVSEMSLMIARSPSRVIRVKERE